MKDIEIAALCNGIYGADRLAASDKDVIWDHFDPGTDGDHVCWGIKRSGDDVAVIFRGSLVLLDWLRDLSALANPFHHDDIGPVHPGFLSGMRTVERELMALAPTDNLILAGHSLGAARATVLAGLLVTDGVKPAARVLFGEPKAGFARLKELLEGIPGRSYVNGDGGFLHDIVTDVPFSAPPEEYVHPTELIRVNAAPEGGLLARLGLFSWHHCPLYVKALTELGV